MKNDFNFRFDLFDGFPDMYFLVSNKGEILDLNQSGKTLTGLKSKAGDTNFIELVEFCDREKVIKTLKTCTKKKNVCNFETKFHLNNKFIPVKLTYSVLQANEKNKYPERIFIIAREIIEEKKKEAELYRFFNIVQNSLNPVQITDLNGKMIYVNTAFIKASGFSKKELIGKSPSIFGSGKSNKSFWEKMWQTISSGKVWYGEIEDRKKNGEPFHSQLLISPIIEKDNKVTGYFGIHRDMSEKITLEKQLINTQKMESIGTLAAGIAHEVGNPLASISALVQVVQRNTEDKFISEKLGLVKSQITRISKIIRDLVDFSKPSNFEFQLTDINESLKVAVEITKVGTKAKDIQFSVNLNGNIPSLPLVADQIEQVFVNILLNAVDALMESNTNSSEKQISVASSLADDQVILTFTDTGHGIEQKNLNKIFEPFFTTKKPGKGTGLGLWVSYGIVKSFRGDLKVKSQSGKGTKFIISLPIET
jgi:PAS domain S-box-containing protein